MPTTTATKVSSGRVRCSKCSYSTAYKCKIDLHENTVHSEIKSVICKFPGCSFKTKTRSCLKGHHQRIHETKLELRRPYPCTFPDCEYRADSQGTLKLHVKARHTPGRTKDFQCALCLSKFCSESGLNGHIARHVKEMRFNCVHCEFSTHDRGSLSTHVKLVHKNLVKFNCSFSGCNYSSTYRLAVRRHFSQKHSSHPDPALRRPLACSFPSCDYRANYSSSLNHHISIHHNPERSQEYMCPFCPKTFYTEPSLRSHFIGVHTLEKGYKCSECDYASSYSANLRRHHRTVHQKKKPPVTWFSCESCDYRTRFKQALGVHNMTAHTSHRRFQCEQAGCNFKTNYAQALKKHMLIHEQSPERQFPVPCRFPGCDFRRRIAEDMKMHERGHETSNVQFKCKICPNKFPYPDKNSLLFHNYLPHKKVPFKCSMCDYGVLHKNALLHHIRERHGSRDHSRKNGQVKTATSSCKAKSRIGDCGGNLSSPQDSSELFQRRACGFKETPDAHSTWKHLTIHSKSIVLIRKLLVKVL